MFRNKRIGVLVHGYNVHFENWTEVVWWRSPEMIGRLPQAALVILYLEPEMVIFGTGSSQKDGKMEAKIMRDTLLEHFLELAILPDFFGVNLEKLREKIKEIAQLETRSKNTYEDIEYTLQAFKTAGIEIVAMVSSPDHIPRCAANAEEIISQHRELRCFRGKVLAWSSQVPYGAEGKWPLVIESSHQLYPLFQKVMKLPPEAKENWIKEALI